ERLGRALPRKRGTRIEPSSFRQSPFGSREAAELSLQASSYETEPPVARVTVDRSIDPADGTRKRASLLTDERELQVWRSCPRLHRMRAGGVGGGGGKVAAGRCLSTLIQATLGDGR